MDTILRSKTFPTRPHPGRPILNFIGVIWRSRVEANPESMALPTHPLVIKAKITL